MRLRRPASHRVLLWALACFAVTHVAFWWLKETAWPEVRDPEYAHKLQRLRQRMRESPARPVVLVLGSSRIGFGFKADMMHVNRSGRPRDPIVFNFGMCQCTPVLQRIMLQRLLVDGVRPACVVIEWYPPFMRAGTNQADEFMNPVRLNWGELRTLERFSEKPGPLRGRWFETQLAGVYAHRHTLMNRYAISWVARQERFDDRWAGMTPWGWTPNHHLVKARDPKDVAEYIVQREPDYVALFRDWAPTEQSNAALREMLADLRSVGIPTALFWAPEPSWMRRWYPPEAMQRIDAYLDNLCQTYQAPLINGRDWLPDELFFEEMHPLYGGAELCARRFESDVLSLITSGLLWSRPR